MKRSSVGLAILFGVSIAARAQGAVVLTNHYNVTLDTGLRGFVASFASQTFNSDGHATGSVASDTSGRVTVPVFNPQYGILQSQGGLVAFTGYPFKATYLVQGATFTIGDEVIAHETVAGTINMFVNGISVASTPFSVSLNPSCTASNNGFVLLDCSDQAKQTYFTAGAPVAIKSSDVVNFQYSMTETNVSCEVVPIGGGSPGLCNSGLTGITDLHNIADPQWDGALTVTYDYIPEPASLSVLGFGLAGLAAARRQRRCA